MRRRHFLALPAASLKAATPLRFFTREEALTISAATALIFPAEGSTPGADAAEVVVYIDRQLAGPYGRDGYRYAHGPFEPGVPEQGYQGKETPAEIYRQGLKRIRGIHKMKPAEQHALLTSIENTIFFSLLRTHTIEGMFCDPMHGGNAGMAGWQLIGFPGPRMSYVDDVERYPGREFRPRPASLRQTVGHPVKPSEDES